MASLSTYVQSVWYRISQGKAEQDIGIYRAAIEQSLTDALSRLGQQVADGDAATAARLRKSFSLTLSSGEIAVSAAMVTSSLPSATLLLSGITEPLSYVPYMQNLLSPLNFSDMTYFTVDRDKISVRDSTGTVPSATSLTVYCSYVPTISEVGDELVNDLSDIGAALVMEVMNQQAVMMAAMKVS